jgi:hypothetical protein
MTPDFLRLHVLIPVGPPGGESPHFAGIRRWRLHAGRLHAGIDSGPTDHAVRLTELAAQFAGLLPLFTPNLRSSFCCVWPNAVRAGAKLEHDPEKWEPVFGKDHAQTKG